MSVFATQLEIETRANPDTIFYVCEDVVHQKLCRISIGNDGSNDTTVFLAVDELKEVVIHINAIYARLHAAAEKENYQLQLAQAKRLVDMYNDGSYLDSEDITSLIVLAEKAIKDGR